ncbi:hypothetical protein MD484_g1915, partial [Candolleomyces efflorescens]
MIVSKPAIIAHSGQIFFNFLCMACYASLASFQAKWGVGPSGLSGFAIFVSIAGMLLSAFMLLTPLAYEKYDKFVQLARTLKEVRVSFILTGTGTTFALLIAFISTISAWTQPGCKDAEKDPSAEEKGDDFKKGLPSWCNTKKAASIFFWFAFLCWAASVALLVLDWRSGRLNPHAHRDPPFNRPTGADGEEEDEDASYTHISPIRQTADGRYDEESHTSTAAPHNPFSDQYTSGGAASAIPPVTAAAYNSVPAGRPSMDAYGAFSDPAPSGFGGSYGGAPSSGYNSSSQPQQQQQQQVGGYAAASPHRQPGGAPLLPEPDLGPRDLRNHGSRMVDEKANDAWNTKDPAQHNPQHAIDMYAIELGTARDVSFLIDFLPSYLFPNGEREIREWGVIGISLGGHVAWMALCHGCPDYSALMTHRAKQQGIPLEPPHFPRSLQQVIERHDPASKDYGSVDPQSNLFIGKQVFVLCGEKDEDVPWTAGADFVEGLEVGATGTKRVRVYPGVGHSCTDEMQEDARVKAQGHPHFAPSSLCRSGTSKLAFAMPRRSANQISNSLPADPQHSQLLAPTDPVSENFTSLRRNWKWAAFCQFFHIFFDLFAINDISVEDIESDLIHGTDVFLPRIMQRLLFTLSYDRKISAENWQNALRRQYDKRDPESNPLGSPSTVVHTAANSRFSSIVKDEVEHAEDEPEEQNGGETAGQEDGGSTRHTSPQTGEKPTNKVDKRAFNTVDDRPHVDWSSLSMDQKLESLHTLVEWQFQNPTRLRMIMKSDDEFASWRAEPVGYDREQNAYWLIGESRLWIQRAPPKPPSRKRKRKAPPADEPKGRNAKAGSSSKRQKLTKAQSKQKKKAEPVPVPPTPTSGRSRAAKEQAKAKLDAQAKALAEFNRQAAAAASSSTRSASARSTRSSQRQESKSAGGSKAFKPTGVRMSARLRGFQEDDDWQPVPEEWLETDGSSKSAKTKTRTGLESDAESISDLTELSDDEERQDMSSKDAEEEEEEPEEEKPAKPSAKDQLEDEERDEPQNEPNPSSFIEWETLCVTIVEWEQFPERFAKSTYYAEKAFYKLLTTVIVPQVVGELKAIEQKRRLEEALNTRKRSSRLATRENEKEAARLAAQKKAEEDERMSRTRRAEARQKREEEDRVKRETAREERRMKRERAAEQETAGVSEEPPSEKEEEAPPPPPPARAEPPAKRQASKPRHKKAAPAVKAAVDDWELECEVCGRKGTNLDDGTPMMSCGSCSKWQHIQCHDKRDRALGRPKRDWDRIEFFCQRCLALRNNSLQQQQQRANGASSHYSSSQQHVQTTMPYAQSWQSQALYNPKAHGHGHHGGYPAQQEPVATSNYAHPQAYLAPTSSVRSSYPSQTAYANPYSTNPISFNHYQPQERSFANDSRGQVPQNQYYRANGSWDPTRYQTYPSQNAWNPNHYGANGSSSTSSSTAPSTAGPPAPIDRRSAYPYENGSSAHHQSAYENPAVNRDGGYHAHHSSHSHQQPPSMATATTASAVSYHRTPYPPHS